MNTTNFERMPKPLAYIAIFTVLVISLVGIIPLSVHAQAITFTHQMKLLNLQGDPITTPVTVRFSLWTSQDFVVGDIDGGGNINVAALTYVYQEIITTTPNEFGVLSVEIGTINPLPSPLPAVMYMQTEVKQPAQPNTSYDLLDADPANATKDRIKATGALSAATSQLQQGLGGLSSVDIFDGTPGQDISGVKVYRIGETADTATTNIELRFGNDATQKLLKWVATEGLFRFMSVVDFDQGLKINNVLNTDPAFGSKIGVTDNFANSGATNLQDVLEDLDAAIGMGGGGATAKTVVVPIDSESTHIHADGTDNAVDLFSDTDTANKRNFYFTETTQGTLQDIDVAIEWPVPPGFVDFQAAPEMKFSYMTTSASSSDNFISLVEIRDTSNTVIPFTGGSNLTSAGSWSEANVSMSSTPTVDTGKTMLFIFKLASKSGFNAFLGEMKLLFNGS